MILRRLRSLPTWPNAFREMDDVRREMEHWFDSFAGTVAGRTAGVYPAIDVSEDSESIYIRAELPGIKVDDLDITVENNTLTLAGKREMSAEAQQASYHRREREWGTFRRSFSLPSRIESDKVHARYEDGILTIILPKAAEARPRQIPVQAGGLA